MYRYYLQNRKINVSNAMTNVPNDIKSLKSNFICTTSILIELE